MKDFHLIDWKDFNRPPYWQQWMCEGDLKELARFGDANLIDVNQQIIKLKNNYDIDKGTGNTLDRIGKILVEPRNGNDDELYRLYLKIRSMLNTADGTVNNIIKAIKALYGSEIVHIIPEYPAAIVILHDGEGPTINFNEILRQVIGAGIDYSTREIFIFEEELESDETVGIMKGKMNMMDSMAYVLHNKMYKRNGTIKHLYTGSKDVLAYSVVVALQDRLFGRTLHNGIYRRNSEIGHGGFITDVASEKWHFDGFMGFNDTVQATEQSEIAFTYDSALVDLLDKPYYHNGKVARNGAIRHTRSSLQEVSTMGSTMAKAEEHLQGRLMHNGLFKRNGTVKHGLSDDVSSESIKVGASIGGMVLFEQVPVSEGMTINGWKYNSHNGSFRRNGTIKHFGRTALPLEG
ncbi:hypothetical protein AGMMS49944_09050 [Spirochaetia bacterium]|nr:hypothetical protein AGMMS49944_09050 [Spirochaetia bacterium]